jgi:hypothetical protein
VDLGKPSTAGPIAVALYRHLLEWKLFLADIVSRIAARVRVPSCKERLAYTCVVLCNVLYKCGDVLVLPVASIIMVGDVAVAEPDVDVSNLGLDVGCSDMFLWFLWSAVWVVPRACSDCCFPNPFHLIIFVGVQSCLWSDLLTSRKINHKVTHYRSG